MFAKLLNCNNFKRKNVLKNIKFVFCGGDKLSEETKVAFDKVLKNAGSVARLNEGYGLTEVVSVCTLNRFNNDKFPSLGQPLEGIDVVILNDENSIVPAFVRGEIAVSGKTLMTGYFNNVEETNKVLITIDGKTFLKTGDCGYLDEQNFLYFVGRIKRMVKISGFNVFFAEIENLVSELGEVNKCVVVPFTENCKTYFKLLVVLNSGFEFDKIIENKILEHCKNNLIKYSVPKIIEVRNELPLTAFGKIDYKNIK